MGLLDTLAPLLGLLAAVTLAACMLWPSGAQPAEPESPAEPQPEADVPWWRPTA